MGWGDALQYLKGLSKKRELDTADSSPRVDEELPMGARIGSVVTIQQTPFIRAAAYASLITVPADADTLIRAISRVDLDLTGNLYRYYLATGDAVGEQEKFLQVFANEQNEVVELLYCTRLNRIIPQTEEEQSAFTGESGVGLGEKCFFLWKEQLAGLGYDANFLQGVFGEADSIRYERDMGDAAVDFVPPFSGSETRIDDAFGQHGLQQQVYFMPYVRALGDLREYLFITTEIVTSQDGDASQRGIYVDFVIGLPLEKERITIL